MKTHWLTILLFLPMLFACTESEITISTGKTIDQPETIIEIYSPETGSILPKDTPFILDYEIIRGKKDNYITIRVDKGQYDKVARIKGQHHLRGLPAGVHTIKVTEYLSNKKPTGAQALITVTMQ